LCQPSIWIDLGKCHFDPYLRRKNLVLSDIQIGQCLKVFHSPKT
jgi:hypothetical protein